MNLGPYGKDHLLNAEHVRIFTCECSLPRAPSCAYAHAHVRPRPLVCLRVARHRVPPSRPIVCVLLVYGHGGRPRGVQLLVRWRALQRAHEGGRLSERRRVQAHPRQGRLEAERGVLVPRRVPKGRAAPSTLRNKGWHTLVLCRRMFMFQHQYERSRGYAAMARRLWRDTTSISRRAASRGRAR